MTNKQYSTLQRQLGFIEGVALAHNDICEPIFNAINIITEIIDDEKNFPIIEHGKWIMDVDEADYEYGTCSICGYIEWDAFGRGDYPFFCSRCGAKMDGDTQ